jgi:serine/threonine protein kinase
MVTGYHPFYERGDSEDGFIKKISRPNLEQTLDAKLEKHDLSPQFKSFVKRLLARSISDRYMIAQALKHPWITRNFSDPIPLTQNEQAVVIE